MTPRTKATDPRARFLEALRKTANVSGACDLIGIDRRTAYRWRDDDAEFAAAWVEAIEAATDSLEAEARRRAQDGVPEYVIGRDGIVKGPDGEPLMQRRYSDGIMLKLLAAYRPERFRERSSVDLNVQGDLAAAIEEGRRRAREGKGE